MNLIKNIQLPNFFLVLIKFKLSTIYNIYIYIFYFMHLVISKWSNQIAGQKQYNSILAFNGEIRT